MGSMRPVSGMSQPVMAQRPMPGMMASGPSYGAPQMNGQFPGMPAQPTYGGYAPQQYPPMQQQYPPLQQMGGFQPTPGGFQGFPYQQQQQGW